MTNLVAERVLRCSSQKGFFGWPDLPEIEASPVAWIDAPDPAARKAIVVRLQAVAMCDVPYLPTGP